MNDIFQEVDEALKQEKIEKFWHEHKDKIITSVIAIFVIAGLLTAYQSWDRKRDGKATQLLQTSLDNQNYEALNDANDTVQSLGHLVAGGEALTNNQKDDAIVQFNKASSLSGKRDVNDLATIRSANLSMNEESNLNAISKDSKSPWQYHALLQESSKMAANKEYSAAIEKLEIVIDSESVSPTLKQRAESIKHVYAINAQSNKKQEQE